MSKSRRTRRRSSTSRSSTTRPAAKQVPAEPVDLAVEYHYVIEDLQRIGVIAAILIGALIVLSFFI